MKNQDIQTLTKKADKIILQYKESVTKAHESKIRDEEAKYIWLDELFNTFHEKYEMFLDKIDDPNTRDYFVKHRESAFN